MPKLMGVADEEVHNTVSGYSFGAVPIKNLGASEYTIVTVVNDMSGSVADFEDDMEKCLGTIVETCRKSPRSGNLLSRLVGFNNQITELHGFRELKDINPDDYVDILDCSGMTALRDALLNCLEATEQYGNQLFNTDYLCNAVVFVITDGVDNASTTATNAKIKKTIEQIRKDEVIESIQVVLIGVNSDAAIISGLKRFQTQTGIDQFIEIGDATPSLLAKLAEFISRSISSSSQALGSGGPSAPINMTF